ncbi:DUF2127 domain-containing protein [Nakamurella silvestris]|nr:DUF2127 domain-containing protein [Nakamurella silvestris]
MDFNLRACGRHGHETYAPDEPELRARLQVQTPAGPAWRCLRCADYVVGDPKGQGPADLAPEVPRGRLLRDRRIMRLLAVERAVRGIGLLGIAFLVFRFRSSRGSLQQKFDTDLPLLRPLAAQLGWNVDDSAIVRTIDDAFSLSATVLIWIAIGLIGYALLQFTEATGLWLMKRWGEYVAAVATAIFLPLEIYELAEKVTVLRVGAFAVNLAAVAWLLWSKRLFGLRGGSAAYHAEHQAESLLTVERAAAAAS